MLALCQIFLELFRSMPEEQMALSLQKQRLAERHPTLRPYQVAQYDTLEQHLRVSIAERTGTRVETDLYPWLAAAAAVAAVRSAIRLWATSESQDDTKQLIELIQAAFTMFSAGLPAPQERRQDIAPLEVAADPGSTEAKATVTVLAV